MSLIYKYMPINTNTETTLIEVVFTTESSYVHTYQKNNQKFKMNIIYCVINSNTYYLVYYKLH